MFELYHMLDIKMFGNYNGPIAGRKRYWVRNL